MTTIFSSATWDSDELTQLNGLRIFPEVTAGITTSRLVVSVLDGDKRVERAIDAQEIRDLRDALERFIENGYGR